MGKVIVISIDALFSSDLEVLSKKPNCGRLLAHSARVDKVHCIYPTYTYPCHTTIMTGCYPDKHGIYHNERFQLNADFHEWYWFAKDIKAETMVSVAKRHGLTTATICWPVMGGVDEADYNIAEIWSKNKDDDPSPVFKSADSPAVESIFEKNKHYLNHMKTPEIDLFATACAVDIIRTFQPDLTFLHLSYVDHQRHSCGCETKQILHALDFIDERVGEVIDAVRESGIYDDTTFILLGDHGHMMVEKTFLLNQVLAEKGFIDHEGEYIQDYRIIAHPSSFSSEIYIKGIDVETAKTVLLEIQKEYPEYIERVLTTEETKALYHLDGPFSFVLEGRDHVIFAPNLLGERVQTPAVGDYKTSISTHGFTPEKGANPPFVICGKRAVDGCILPKGNLVDEAPTIMSLFGLAMKETDGVVLKDLLRF